MPIIVKMLYVALGSAALLVGIIGIVLPLIPTTPLLLLAAFCFVKGSERFDRWFKASPLYRKYVEPFLENRSMTLRQKVIISTFADAMLITAMVLTDRWFVWVILIAIMLYKYYYFLFKIKTIKEGRRMNE